MCQIVNVVVIAWKSSGRGVLHGRGIAPEILSEAKNLLHLSGNYQ